MVLMDGPESQLLQSFDSFWFFSNIFSCTTKTQNHVLLLGAADQNSNTEGHAEMGKEHILVETEEKDSKPISPTIEVQEKCGENERPIRGGCAEKRRSARRSKRRKQRREVFGELDLGCDWMVVDEVERYLYGNSSSPLSSVNGGQNYLPPLNVNDGVAMKEHLKSWAYAVASTVK